MNKDGSKMTDSVDETSINTVIGNKIELDTLDKGNSKEEILTCGIECL